jgi:hypothetical protein
MLIMSRSTFSGPILSGDQRFGALRDVGYAALAQFASLTFTNATANTAGYAGTSGQFVGSNAIPNGNAVVYSPSSSTYPPVAATPTADSATEVYRGFVAYLPVNSRIEDLIVDIGVVPTQTGATSTSLYISNGFNTGTTPQYGSIATLATGRNAVTVTATQLSNWQATTSDITNAPANDASLLSQVVFTFAINGTGMTGGPTAGQAYITIRYTQADGNIGSTTAYPYGNLD